MFRLSKEGTCIIHGTEKGKTCALKVTNEKWYNSISQQYIVVNIKLIKNFFKKVDKWD